MPVLKRVWVEKFLEDVVAQTVDSCTRPTRLNWGDVVAIYWIRPGRSLWVGLLCTTSSTQRWFLSLRIVESVIFAACSPNHTCRLPLRCESLHVLLILEQETHEFQILYLAFIKYGLIRHKTGRINKVLGLEMEVMNLSLSLIVDRGFKALAYSSFLKLISPSFTSICRTFTWTTIISVWSLHAFRPLRKLRYLPLTLLFSHSLSSRTYWIWWRRVNLDCWSSIHQFQWLFYLQW